MNHFEALECLRELALDALDAGFLEENSEIHWGTGCEGGYDVSAKFRNPKTGDKLFLFWDSAFQRVEVELK
jgi:hypothetical protein